MVPPQGPGEKLTQEARMGAFALPSSYGPDLAIRLNNV